jgi:cytochrome c oxidase assembly factor CtaG
LTVALSAIAIIVVVFLGYKLDNWLSRKRVNDPHLKAVLFVLFGLVLIGYLNGSLGWAVDGDDCYGSGITLTC